MRRSILLAVAALSIAAVATLSDPASAQVVGSLPSGGSSATIGRTETPALAPSGRRSFVPAIAAKRLAPLRAIREILVFTRRGHVL